MKKQYTVVGVDAVNDIPTVGYAEARSPREAMRKYAKQFENPEDIRIVAVFTGRHVNVIPSDLWGSCFADDVEVRK